MSNEENQAKKLDLSTEDLLKRARAVTRGEVSDTTSGKRPLEASGDQSKEETLSSTSSPVESGKTSPEQVDQTTPKEALSGTRNFLEKKDTASSGSGFTNFRKKGWKKFLPWVGVGLVIVILAIGGFSFLRNRKKTKEPATLTYWGLWEPEAVIQGVIADWEKDHPDIKVKYIKQDKEDYRARLQSAFSRGEGPDIFRFHQSWTPMVKENLSPVPQSVATSLGLENNYFSVVKETLTCDGQIYGVPLMIDTLGLYYNKEILEAANKSLPKTWWGLENLAKEMTVTSSEKILVAGAGLGTISNVDHWSDIVGLMIYQNGGTPAQPDNLIEDVLRYYLKFANDIEVWNETLPSTTTAFAQEDLVFYFAPSWRTFNLLEMNPSLDFGVTTVPQLPELKEVDWEAAEKGEAELTDINWATFWAEGVNPGSRYSEEAWQFLEFLASKETLQKMYTAQSQIRLFGEIYPRKDLAQDLVSDSIVGPFVDQAETARSWYLCSNTHDAGINDRIIKYYENALNALTEGDPEEEIWATLQSGVGQVLDQYQSSNN